MGLTEPTVIEEKKAAPSAMEHVFAVNTHIDPTEDMACTVVESISDNTEHKLRPSSITVVRSLPNSRSDIGQELADLGVVTKAEIEAMLQSSLNN